MFDYFSDTVFNEDQSNAEFFMLGFYVPYLEIALFYVLSFLFFQPKGFHYLLVRSVII